MAWIKQNYDRFLLAVFALVLLICAGLLINNARGYNEVFKSLSDRVPKKTGDNLSVPETDIADRKAQLTEPAIWTARTVMSASNKPISLPLFRSQPIIDDGGKAVPLDGSIILHAPIPNDWLTDHKQDLLATNVLEQDSDGDGFSTLDEWGGPNAGPNDPHTDPNDKASHPPYYTKLYFKRVVRVPFRMRFEAKNGKKFFLNETDNEDAQTQVKELGEVVTLGKFHFKLTSYSEKYDTSQHFKRDISELTLTNVDTGQTVILPKGEDVNSPETYAVLNYVWSGPGAKPEFAVKKDEEFALAPESNVKYKVTELDDTGVKVSKLDDKKELTIRAQGR